jgi:hypothetical protein
VNIWRTEPVSNNLEGIQYCVKCTVLLKLKLFSAVLFFLSIPSITENVISSGTANHFVVGVGTENFEFFKIFRLFFFEES